MKTLAQHILEGFNEHNENLIDSVVGDFDDKKKKGIAENETPEEEEITKEVSENLEDDLEKEKPTE